MEYTELEVWKESRVLVSSVYEITKEIPKDELYCLTSQMRRSVVSIPSNIAEGCGRRTSADTIKFLHVSRGSLHELVTQLYLALDLNYIETKNQKIVLNQILKCKKLLNGFVNYYKKL